MAIRFTWFQVRWRAIRADALQRLQQWGTPLPLGLLGERTAARYLKRRGHTIVATRARDRLGEIDLVTVAGRTIVFVEVKTRRSLQAGDPADAVDERKQRRLTRVALAFLRRHDLLDSAVRFDVVSVLWPKSAPRPTIRHLEHAFEPLDRWQMHA